MPSFEEAAHHRDQPGDRPGATLLHEALRGTAAAPTPRHAALAVLKACVRRFEAFSGCVYMLDLRSGRYSPFVSWPRHGARAREIPAEDVLVPRVPVVTAAEFTGADVGVRNGHAPAPDGIVVFARRSGSCVGAIRLDGPELSKVEPALLKDLIASANLLATVFEDEFAFNLLGALQQPLDFQQSEEEFFGQIAILIAMSTGMEFVALGERAGGALRCTALWGFGDDPRLADWDLEPINRHPAFRRALEGETVAVSSIEDPRHAALLRHPWGADVRSFVATPVRVGAETFGVLSVGARCRFRYALIELRGIESIANGIGVSIANHRNSRQLSHQVGKFTEAATAITALEVARAARHEAVGHIDNCNLGLNQLWKKAGKPVEPELDAVSAELERLDGVLKKIQFATKPPAAHWEEVSVVRLWNEARTAVSGRLHQEGIQVGAPAVDAEVLALPDWLRQVFLNLLLNSIDAFGDARKGGRRIELAIERPSQRARDVQMTYTDNATGINPQRLSVPSEFAGLTVQQQVFEPGVTSKRDGSGFGLWLVRRILDDHGGSIDLIDHRVGATFQITLPKPERAPVPKEGQT